MAGDPRDAEASPRTCETSDPDEPWLVVLCGLPGVGKSTVAAFVTERLAANRIRTDAVRKGLFEDPQYTDKESETVYGELYDRTRESLGRGESVVLDATFADRRRRHEARSIADDLGTNFRLLEVVCDRAVAEERIAERDDISDADVEVYRHFREEFHPIEMHHVPIDNSGTKAETRAQVERVFSEPR